MTFPASSITGIAAIFLSASTEGQKIKTKQTAQKIWTSEDNIIEDNLR